MRAIHKQIDSAIHQKNGAITATKAMPNALSIATIVARSIYGRTITNG